MAKMKCRYCLNLDECSKQGITPSSLACKESFQPNWKKLPKSVKYIRNRLLPLKKLGGNYYDMFDLWWNEKPIKHRLNLTIDKRCASCYYYDIQHKDFDYICSEAEDIFANTKACPNWELDLEKRYRSRHCPTVLKELVAKTLTMKNIDKWGPYIKFLIKRVKHLDSPITFGDDIEFHYSKDIIIYGKVVDIEEESVKVYNNDTKQKLVLHFCNFNETWFKKGTREEVRKNRPFKSIVKNKHSIMAY